MQNPSGLCNTGAVLYQLSYQVNWELVMLWGRDIWEKVFCCDTILIFS